ncbi:sigma-70 family RNA polymerase sigma factor [Pseudonocardia adelaidensis]|uniref:Sigma-70 family RNA polymerase sigma factor n=1 Tax=Pseudonocardia adelaidensis TaxID=648754 RepID=A0ABP9NR20_9PSEU
MEVEEIDAITERGRRLGASVLLPAREGPAGWSSVLRSSVGGEIALWQPEQPREGNGMTESTLLEAAVAGNESAYVELVEGHRRALHAHCYRMLGSVHDAEDAVQETLLRAWRGLSSFQGRSSLRSWLYTIATNVCLRAIERRPGRVLPIGYGPPADPHEPLGEPLVESTWIEPYPDERLGLDGGPAGPEARYEQRESIELAFVAALQHLPARQRAVLILRDVLGFSGAEVAAALETTPASVYSTLQRAHQTVEQRIPEVSQQATLRSLGDEGLRAIVDSYVRAWERNDVDAIAAMLTESATIAMPPTATWYRGRCAVAAGLGVLALSGRMTWRLTPTRANGQLAVVASSRDRGGTFVPNHVAVLTLRGSLIDEINFFLTTSHYRGPGADESGSGAPAFAP